MTSTKRQYLRQFKRALYWRLSRRGMIQEVLADYEGFFDDGIRAGHSEAELCAQFGPPKRTACELSRAEGFGGKPLGLLAVAVFVLTVLLDNVTIPGSLLCVGQVFLPFIAFRYPGCAWFTVPLIPLLWGLWRKAPIVAASQREKRRAALLCAAAALLWLASLAAGLLLIARWGAADADEGMELVQMLCWIEIALAAVLLLSLLRAWRLSLWYLIPAVCCQGFLAGISRFLNWQYFMLCALPLWSGLLAAVLGAALTAWLICCGTALERRLREAMRTENEDRSGRRLGLLLVWPLLALWLTRGLGPLFDWSEALPLIAAPLLLPVLCLAWGGGPKGPAPSPRGRRELAVLLSLPLLFLLAFAGLILYAAYMPEGLAGSGQGNAICVVYIVLGLLTAFVMLSALVKSWLESPAFLLPAAHCAGILAALGVCVQILFHFDPSEAANARFVSGLAAGILAPYALGWLGAGVVVLI